MSNGEPSEAREQRFKQCEVSTCKLETFESLPFPSTSWEYLTYDAIKSLHDEQGKKGHHGSFALKDISNFIARHSPPQEGGNIEEEVSAALSTQTYLFLAVSRTRGQPQWSLQPASLQRSAFALSDASNGRARRRRGSVDIKAEPIPEPTPTTPVISESRKRRRPSVPSIPSPVKRVAKTFMIKLENSDYDEDEEEEIDIDGDFVDLFSGTEVNEALDASLDDGSSEDDSASLSDIDVLYFGDEDGAESMEDDDYRERPLKRARLDPAQASAGSQRVAAAVNSRRSQIINEMTLEDLEEVEKKRRTSKAKQRLKKNSVTKDAKVTREPKALPLRTAISSRRAVPIIDQYDEQDGPMSEVMYSDADALSDEVHPSDDEFNEDPILIEIVPEWQWPGVEHHPFFLHDKKGNGSKDEPSGPSSSGHVSETHDKSSSKSEDDLEEDDDDLIDILGGSSDSDDELPLKQPLVADSNDEEEENGFSPDEQPALSDVANQNLFIPTWRIVDIDGDVIVSVDPSSNDDELPESAYKKMHRRRELIEKMELREFLKARKKRTRGKKI